MSFTLQQYCENGDIDGVNDRLEEGEDPDEYDENGMTALCIAAAAGNTEIVDILIDVGIDKVPRGQEKPSDHTPVWIEIEK